MAWARNGTPDTLGSAGDTLQITDLTAKKINVILHHLLANASGIVPDLTTDNNTNTDYASRESVDGATDTTSTNDTSIDLGNGSHDTFQVTYGINISGEEKLFISNSVLRGASGAAGAPDRYEVVGKVDTTTNSGQYSRIDLNNSGTGDYDTGSNLSALAGDVTETVTLQDGTIFEETDTNKSYIWNSSTITWTQL